MRPVAAALLSLALIMASQPAAAERPGPGLPPPLSRLTFGMTVSDATNAMPQAEKLVPGINFGRLKGLLVVPEAEAFSSSFRIYLQFDHADTLQQILLERRHATATRQSAGNIQNNLVTTFGEPDETCLTPQATPAEARITWRKAGWTLHLIGFDDLGQGIRTVDTDSVDPLKAKPLDRSRDEKLRSRQQRSLPRRILVRIHGADDRALEPPACDKH
ncbi:hypothetical protein [Nisaea denitrificans]|uniref:hypothetical protein n=1 Tax=Nisaea denitrificans TaxID=390877 RepID=UPI00041132CC|nr:hypothetical protein [Nisaea denitrificans]